MPAAAIGTGCVDATLHPDLIAPALLRRLNARSARRAERRWIEPFDN
jgi:hypothetical protein